MAKPTKAWKATVQDAHAANAKLRAGQRLARFEAERAVIGAAIGLGMSRRAVRRRSVPWVERAR